MLRTVIWASCVKLHALFQINPNFFSILLLLSVTTSSVYSQIYPAFLSPSLLSSLSSSLQVALGRNQPLKRERPKWKSDYPMTEGQLRSKRDEFWDTAPAFEGRKEIWDALRAAASAFESNDHLLAQAILDGASITLPHGNSHFRCSRHSRCLIMFVLLTMKWPLGGLYVGQWSWWSKLTKCNSLFLNPGTKLERISFDFFKFKALFFYICRYSFIYEK